jgi:AraC-like DNA-binding protein
MDAIIITLCVLLMNYYGGLTFITWGRSRRYITMHDRVFDDYFGIQYNNAGPLRFAQGREALHSVEGPYAFVSFPGERFRYGTLPGDEPRDHLWVCFRGPRVKRFTSSGLLSIDKRPYLRPVLQPGLFLQGLEDVHACLAAEPVRQARAVYLIEGLLLQLHEQDRMQRRPGRFDQPMETLGRALSGDFLRTWDFTDEARRMCLSPSHFRRLFHERFGCAPRQYLLRRRLEHAAGLLRTGNESIQAIASSVGFCDVYYFTRQFSKQLHLPPARYRREYVGER